MINKSSAAKSSEYTMKETTSSCENGVVHCLSKSMPGSVSVGHAEEGFMDEQSQEQQWELRRIQEKRVKSKVSEGLSPEGQLAMELAKVEVNLARKRERREKRAGLSKQSENMSGTGSKKVKPRRHITFVDAYESSSASRLSGDILDENAKDCNPKRWALGGGNIGVAMETVEIVSYGESSSDSEADDVAIAETAKLNSVEKCLVWMGVLSQNEYPEDQ